MYASLSLVRIVGAVNDEVLVGRVPCVGETVRLEIDGPKYRVANVEHYAASYKKYLKDRESMLERVQTTVSTAVLSAIPAAEGKTPNEFTPGTAAFKHRILRKLLEHPEVPWLVATVTVGSTVTEDE